MRDHPKPRTGTNSDPLGSGPLSNVLSNETTPDIMESLRKALARVEEAEKRWERMTALLDKLDSEKA